METHKDVKKHNKTIAVNKGDLPKVLIAGVQVPLTLFAALGIILSLISFLYFPSTTIAIIFAIAVLFSVGLCLLPPTFSEFKERIEQRRKTFIILFVLFSWPVALAITFREHLKQNIARIFPFFVTLMLYLILPTADPLLITLITFYLVISVLLAGRHIKLQTAIIICLAVTAIMFRVYPAMSDKVFDPQTGEFIKDNNPMAGHLISMDDPYYHYKFTHDLYTNGDIIDRDMRVYPPDGLHASHMFSYYFTVYLAQLTGVSLESTIILYPVIMSAFGAIMIFFLLKELAGDWKSGLIGGFLFATMSMLLSKSQAGAVEEDIMGMVMGIFAIYLLVKALKSEGNTSLKFAVLSGIAFLITLISWSGVQFLFVAPMLAVIPYLYLSAVFRIDSWQKSKAILVMGLTFLVAKFILVDKFGSITLNYAMPIGLAIAVGLWGENIRERLPKTSVSKALLATGLIGLILLYYSMLVEPSKDISYIGSLLAVFLLIGSMLLTSVLVLFSKPGKEQKKAVRKASLTIEESLKSQLPVLTTLFLVLAIVGILIIGVDKVAGISNNLYEGFAGISASNFLVDKTISEQAVFSSGSLNDKLWYGFLRYGIGEALTIAMAVIGALLLIYYLYTKKYERLVETSLPYLVGLMFFLIAMRFVWLEARLGFSQSLGLLVLGAMFGLLLPGDKKGLSSLRILPLILLVIALPLTTFTLSGSTWSESQRSAAMDPNWFEAVKWLDANIKPGEFVGNGYSNGDYVFTWWDYGHFITALSRSTVITDPTQADENYIMRTARFFYNTTSEDEAIAWLMQQPWNKDLKTKYIILDHTLVSKASALAFLGTNYYEYPNGEAAVDGVCSSGQICQNIETGETAKIKDGKYSCTTGVVCTRDTLTSVELKQCCEAKPTACCDTSYDWTVVNEKGGSAYLSRSPGTPVYGQYQITTTQMACRPEYVTKVYATPQPRVEHGVVKELERSYLYIGDGGLPYGDGGDYPAFVVFMYADGDQQIKLISPNCEVKDYAEVLSLGKDQLRNLGYGIKLAEGIYAPQIFIHVPERWMNSMFTKLYLQDADGLKYFRMFDTNETDKFYPAVKVYEITYPSEIPKINPNAAKTGDIVEADYTGRLENGTVFDTSIGSTPLKFTIGSQQVIPGFEEAVIGMEVGQSKMVTIPPEKAYGYSGSPLSNKTLVFDITVVSINKETVVPTDVNMTYDYYNPSLKDLYNLDRYPSVVWDCGVVKFGLASSGVSEEEALAKITCALSKGQPEDVCGALKVGVNSEGKITGISKELQAVMSKMFKITGVESCPVAANTSLIQAFYTKDCPECATQKAALDAVEAMFGGYLKVDYYCVGDAEYCVEKSGITVQ